jgi:hypothetical protein
VSAARGQVETLPFGLVWLYVISGLVTGAAFLNSTLWLRRSVAAGT